MLLIDIVVLILTLYRTNLICLLVNGVDFLFVCLLLLVEGNCAGQHSEGGSERRKD